MIVSDQTRLRVPSVETEFDAQARLLAKKLHGTAAVNPRQALGLAAPQIGVRKRVFWWDLGRYSDRGNIPRTGVAFNPEVLETSDETWDAVEGCLSFKKSVAPLVRRPRTALILWHTDTGERCVAELSGMPGRVWLHEIDHLLGRTMVDRAADPEAPYLYA